MLVPKRNFFSKDYLLRMQLLLFFQTMHLTDMAVTFPKAEGQSLDIHIYICNRKSKRYYIKHYNGKLFVCSIFVKQPKRLFAQGLISGKMFYSSRELIL